MLSDSKTVQDIRNHVVAIKDILQDVGCLGHLSLVIIAREEGSYIAFNNEYWEHADDGLDINYNEWFDAP